MYAVSGTGAFNERLGRDLEALTREVRSVLGPNLSALILGGGYGRGEGGVRRVGGSEYPYNDLDLFLVVKNRLLLPQDRLRTLVRTLEDKLGVHVDFSRPFTLEDIRNWPCELMWKELLEGHRVLWGPENVLTQAAPDRLKEALSEIEASKLLLNRGAGLLRAIRIASGHEPAPDEDFVRRNYFKCALALGDALLIAYGRHQTQYRDRDEAFSGLCRTHETIRRMNLDGIYREALHFKTLPSDFESRQIGLVELNAMTEQWCAVFLHVESVRTGRSWRSAGDYARWGSVREPAQNGPARWVRNLIKNLKVGALSLRYPREEIYRLLPSLLRPERQDPVRWAASSRRLLRRWQEAG